MKTFMGFRLFPSFYINARTVSCLLCKIVINPRPLQSFAEAAIPFGVTTLMYVHRVTDDDLYHITQGEGLMHLAGNTFLNRTCPSDYLPKKQICSLSH